jgi:hypothetical protein
MGRQVWLILAVTIGLALGTQAAAAKECQRETPCIILSPGQVWSEPGDGGLSM